MVYAKHDGCSLPISCKKQKVDFNYHMPTLTKLMLKFFSALTSVKPSTLLSCEQVLLLFVDRNAGDWKFL